MLCADRLRHQAPPRQRGGWSPERLKRMAARQPALRGPFLPLNLATLALVVAGSLLPLCYVVYLSLIDARPGTLSGQLVGLDNYAFAFSDSTMVNAIWNTLYFSTASVALAVLVGLAIATLIDGATFLRGFLMLAVVLPWALPEVVTALMWQWLFNSKWGLVNGVLHATGLIDRYLSFFSDGTVAMHVLIFAYSWKLVPFVVIILFAALQSIPDELYESAQIDGAGSLRISLHHPASDPSGDRHRGAVLRDLVDASLRPHLRAHAWRPRRVHLRPQLLYVLEGVSIRRFRRGSGRLGHSRTPDARHYSVLLVAAGTRDRRRMRRANRSLGRRVTLLAAACVAAAYLLGPPAWLLLSSITPEEYLRAVPPRWIPPRTTLANYQAIFQIGSYDRQALDAQPEFKLFTPALRNSLILATSLDTLMHRLGCAKRLFARALRASPLTAIRHAGTLVHSHAAIDLASHSDLSVLSVSRCPEYVNRLDCHLHCGLLLPFVIWILEGFFRKFPIELEEAGTIDGATPFGVFRHIVLPLSLNGLFAAGAFVFISTWSDFIVALLLTSSIQAFPDFGGDRRRQ